MSTVRTVDGSGACKEKCEVVDFNLQMSEKYKQTDLLGEHG